MSDVTLRRDGKEMDVFVLWGTSHGFTHQIWLLGGLFQSGIWKCLGMGADTPLSPCPFGRMCVRACVCLCEGGGGPLGPLFRVVSGSLLAEIISILLLLF